MNSNENNWKSMVYMTGAALGLVTGLAAAFLYARAAEENHADGMPPRIDTGDAFRIGMVAVGLIREISSLGAKTEKIDK